ncbi:MAG: type II CRISPR-associated endonuclease Cas1 [Phycisphaerae bacterium]|nr:type II CRISPR-associated endonuclease Cas1 [Phycisphaerae bacterium]
MVKRTLEISSEGMHLCVQDRQLLILPHGRKKSECEPRNRVPAEDLGFVVVDHRDTTYSHSALALMAEVGAVLVVCGGDHLPAGMLLPMAEHTEVVWRIDDQINIGKVTQKQVWSEIVEAKVRAQASLLDVDSETRREIENLSRRVRSGDPENIESQAARYYWSALLGGSFRRTPGTVSGGAANAFLDYGYALLRAAVARTLVGAGLLPAIGIKHSNRSNAFCLADDLMEPLRPMVDRRARFLVNHGHATLDPHAKRSLLPVLTETVRTRAGEGPLHVVLPRFVSSYAERLRGGKASLEIPEMTEVPGL